jgi:hypothetical protein
MKNTSQLFTAVTVFVVNITITNQSIIIIRVTTIITIVIVLYSTCFQFQLSFYFNVTYLPTYSVALVRKRTIPTERPPLVGEVSANTWTKIL